MTTQKAPTTNAYWHKSSAELFRDLQTTATGLNTAEAVARLSRLGHNVITARRHVTALQYFLAQFKNPLVLILIFASLVSASAREWMDAAITLAIVLGSALLSFRQEYRASVAVEKLRERVAMKTLVLRDGEPTAVPADTLTPGDVVLLSAGSLIPADSVLLEANNLYVNQAVLTGETFPVEKKVGIVPIIASLAERTNCVLMGTSVRSGVGKAVIVRTGATTEFGQIAGRLNLRPPETEFERGIRHFGYLLTWIMMILVLLVITVNLLAHKPPIDSLLFAIALAVGLTPELLPAIITITLAQGAQYMAAHGVIVRRLVAIENLGGMDVLCTDKTGTLTEGMVRLDSALDVNGQLAPMVLRDAYLNAFFQTGLANPLDEAITDAANKAQITAEAYTKQAELPYDFVRKRLSVLVQDKQGQSRLLTKGALDSVLSVCTTVQVNGTVQPLTTAHQATIQQQYQQWSTQGFRVLGLATKTLEPSDQTQRAPVQLLASEMALTFSGFLRFLDPPKAGIKQTVSELAQAGVQLKVITGDNRYVAQHVATLVGIPTHKLVTGTELDEMHDEALWQIAERTDIFAEVDPNQKERIILALQKMGHVVGYLGDGINDAPALHAADVGISVDQAVDVAKEAADIVLLEQDLGILYTGLREGRKTFANTIKYIFTTESANFGNMVSMAGASLILPFLPLLANQILLNNFLSDFPAVTIASDAVDPAWLDKPHRWDIRFIRDFMVIFGLVSSAFDYCTFGLLLWVFHTTTEQFRTGWFIESLLTELVIALVVRTRRRFYQSKPGHLLWQSTLLVGVITLLIPYLPGSQWLGFTPLSPWLLLAILLITAFYVAVTELAKVYFYRRVKLS